MATPFTTTKLQGGFDCEFIKHPPEDFQIDCPVCLLVLREPHQVSCCGYTFCRTCIERVQLQKGACPTCNEADFTVFQDKRLQRSLYAYHVRCSHEKEGCQWTGELGELDKHLNVNPKPSEQLVGCEAVEIECRHCSGLFQRRYVNTHQAIECIRRPFSCEYCRNYKADYEDVTSKHWPVCKSYLVPCPNECGANPERQNLEHHVSKYCPLTIIDCDFHYTGCEVQLPRKDMPAHLAENLVPHMAKLVTYNQNKVQEKEQQILQLTKGMTEKLEENRLKIDQLERKNEALSKSLLEKEQEIAQLKAKQEEDHSSVQALQLYAGPPVDRIMTEFEKHRQDGDLWFSEPFCTHPYGYKMCLCVHANGWNTCKGTHVSVFGCLVKGKFDDYLKWPFRGDITIQLINHLQDEHHTQVVEFSKANSSSTSRVATEEYGAAWGHSNFISHSNLHHTPAKNRQFLKDDCLHFRVTRVSNIDTNLIIQLEKQCLAIESRVCVPPIQFTMKEFECHKRERQNRTAEWLSPSFYTHPQGYRMCLGVFADGIRSGAGTHVTA